MTTFNPASAKISKVNDFETRCIQCKLEMKVGSGLVYKGPKNKHGKTTWLGLHKHCIERYMANMANPSRYIEEEEFLQELGTCCSPTKRNTFVVACRCARQIVSAQSGIKTLTTRELADAIEKVLPSKPRKAARKKGSGGLKTTAESNASTFFTIMNNLALIEELGKGQYEVRQKGMKFLESGEDKHAELSRLWSKSETSVPIGWSGPLTKKGLYACDRLQCDKGLQNFLDREGLDWKESLQFMMVGTKPKQHIPKMIVPVAVPQSITLTTVYEQGKALLKMMDNFPAAKQAIKKEMIDRLSREIEGI